MNELVFFNNPTVNAEPYTTSEVIAKYAGVKRRSIDRVITTQIQRLEHHGKVRFNIAPLPSGQQSKVYQLNEPQATLLITFLKNTEQVANFKDNLVKQFYAARAELATRRAYRSIEGKTRRTLTDSIQAWSHRNQWSYKQFTDLLCKATTEMNVKQLRQERAAGTKAPAADLYTAAEQADYQRLERGAIALMDIGQTYEQIKAAVLAMNAVATSQRFNK